jgi:hypothetical protein
MPIPVFLKILEEQPTNIYDITKKGIMFVSLTRFPLNLIDFDLQ